MREARLLQTSGVEFSYREFGPADGLPVLLLHGFPYAATGWQALVDLLQPLQRNLRLIVPSMRGYGATRVREENLVSGQEAALTDDMLVLTNALNIDRFYVIGHDWGARTGFDLSVLAPEKVLGHLALASPYVMFDGRPLPPVQVHQYWYQWYFQTAQGEKGLRENAHDLCRLIWSVWSPTWKFSEAEFEATAAEWQNPQFATVVLDSYRHRWGNSLGRPAYAAQQAKLSAQPKTKIATPTIFAYGTADGCVAPEASAEQAKYFTGFYERVAMKGIGHCPQQEDPKTTAKLFERLRKKVGH